MEAESGRVLYAKDADTPRLIASTTKLMTALVALESGHSLEEVVTIPAEAAGVEGSSLYLKAGETVKLKTLLYGMLLQSGNDAATAVALYCAGSLEAFAQKMNEKAQQLGMTNSHFTNPTGLDGEEHYSSAYDMALLARACLDVPELKEITATRSTTMEGRTFVNHNKLLWRYEGCVGMKTGYTQGGGAHPGVGGGAGRYDPHCRHPQRAQRLGGPRRHAGLRVCKLPDGRGGDGGTEPVQPACLRQLSALCSLKAEETLRWPVGPGESLETRLELGGLTSLEAPVQAGVPMGRVEVLLNGEVVGESDLSCAIAVHRDRQEHTGWLDWLFG